MAKKPVTFKPTLTVPVGINNYTGKMFRCFTRGDTLPFRFTLGNADGTALDVTNWTVTVIMSDKNISKEGCADKDAITVEVDMPLIDLAARIFEGKFLDVHTQKLPAGLIYALAKYTTAPTGDAPNITPGDTFYIDMCQLEVYPNLNVITR